MKEPGWPADHDIGVYLSVGGLKTLVATARRREDLSTALRHLADEWDLLTASQAFLSGGPVVSSFGE